MKHVLVTGAGGFVGRHVTRAMANAGHHVIAGIHKTIPDAIEGLPNVSITQIELSEASRLSFNDGVDAVVHCASALPSNVADPDRLYRINTDGTERLLEAVLEAGARTFINCSSMSVYGQISVPVVTVDTPLIKPDAYGRSKRDNEKLLSRLVESYPLSALSLRLPGVVGRGSHNNFLSNVMAKIIGGETIQARNPDALFNNIVHVDDLADFTVSLLATLNSGHGITTIAATEPIAVKKVISLLFEEAGAPEKVRYSDDGNSFLIDTDCPRSYGFAGPSTTSCVRRFARDCVSKL